MNRGLNGPGVGGWRLAVGGWRKTRRRNRLGPEAFSGHRSRLQVRAQAQVRESGPGPSPEPEYPDQIPDGRDLRPENDLSTPANHPAGVIHSVLNSVLKAVLHSALSGELGPLSSVIRHRFSHLTPTPPPLPLPLVPPLSFCLELPRPPAI